MIRYDLTSLDPAVRVALLRDVNSRGILNTYIDGTLSVANEFEQIVDRLITDAEARGLASAAQQEKSQAISRGSRSMECEQCGAIPAASLMLRRQVGMVIAMKSETFEAVLCAYCGENLRKWIQKQNALKGWTGLRSAAMNPAIIGSNERNYKRFKESLEKDAQP